MDERCIAPAAWAQNVKITPLGSHTGELCDRDRATIFEDPTGVRIRSQQMQVSRSVR